METLHRDESGPGWDGVGKHKVSSHYSEWHAISNLRIAYFWNFPLNIFGTRQPQVTETAESKTTEKGESRPKLLAVRTNGKYFRLLGHSVLQRRHRQYIRECVWLYSSKFFFLRTGRPWLLFADPEL